MLEKETKQQSVEIWPIPFHNYDPINAQLENTGKLLFALQHTSPLHSVVYSISEANPSTSFNLMIHSIQHTTVEIFHLGMLLAYFS